MTDYNPNQPHYYAPQQPQPKPKKKWPWVVLGAGAVGILAFGGCAALVANSVDETLSSVTAPAPTAPSGLPTSGVLKVGTDIEPGTYAYTVVDGSWGAYYARLSCLNASDLNCIITNDVAEPGTSGYLVVEPTDVALDLSDLILTPQ
ncbi:membrane protein [Rhodococcus phage Jflix2]|nr:membrane protein [Rhodococcus phage Jflix2]